MERGDKDGRGQPPLSPPASSSRRPGPPRVPPAPGLDEVEALLQGGRAAYARAEAYETLRAADAGPRAAYERIGAGGYGPAPPRRQQQLPMSITEWKDQQTACFLVECNGWTVARRQDNNWVNGTKLLNLVGMTRGKRDALLKGEPLRRVVKHGTVNLKGVWIPLERAQHYAKQGGIDELLFPFLDRDMGGGSGRGASFQHRPMIPPTRSKFTFTPQYPIPRPPQIPPTQTAPRKKAQPAPQQPPHAMPQPHVPATSHGVPHMPQHHPGQHSRAASQTAAPPFPVSDIAGGGGGGPPQVAGVQDLSLYLGYTHMPSSSLNMFMSPQTALGFHAGVAGLERPVHGARSHSTTAAVEQALAGDEASQRRFYSRLTPGYEPRMGHQRYDSTSSTMSLNTGFGNLRTAGEPLGNIPEPEDVVPHQSGPEGSEGEEAAGQPTARDDYGALESPFRYETPPEMPNALYPVRQPFQHPHPPSSVSMMGQPSQWGFEPMENMYYGQDFGESIHPDVPSVPRTRPRNVRPLQQPSSAYPWRPSTAPEGEEAASSATDTATRTHKRRKTHTEHELLEPE